MSASTDPVLVRAIAAERLPGSRLELPSEPLDAASWREVFGQVVQERLLGMLSSAVRAGRFAVTPEQRREVAEAEAAQASVTVRLDRALLDVAGLLEGRAIPFRVLKGAALAYAAYDDPALRSYGDVDVLVPSDRLDEAIATIVAAGGMRRFAEPRPGFLRRFGKGVSVRRSDGLEIDIHRTLVPGPFGLSVDLDDLFGPPTSFELAGRELLGLGPTPRLLHACFHAVLGSSRPRLVSVRDVAQLALDLDLDLDEVVRTAARWHATAIVASAVETAWRTLDIADATPMSSWAAAYETTPREQRQLAVYAPTGNRYPRQAVAALWAIPHLRDRAAYLWAMFVPSRAYLRERDGSYVRRARRSLTVLRDVESAP